jgi:hypothetical protein
MAEVNPFLIQQMMGTQQQPVDLLGALTHAASKYADVPTLVIKGDL